MAAMAVANYKRRTTQMQKSQEESAKFNQQQSTQSNNGVPDQGCFSSSQPTTSFTGGDGGKPSGTKKWSCDADGVTINTKWFPSTSSSR